MLPEDHNYDDARTYALLSSGHTIGCFQLESSGMRRLLRTLRPRTLEDVAAVVSLYRPGPMGANAHQLFAKRVFVSLHEELDSDLEPVLGSTYGLIVFQEQVLQVLNIVCGWDYGEAELLFNAMRKKDHSKMEAAKPGFEADGASKGYSQEALRTLWETLVPFADYSFNKSHATGYALLAYETAYLKAHHPKEYMCSLLSSVNEMPLYEYGKPTKKKEYLDETKRMGFHILPPDINESEEDWTPLEGDRVRYGLSSIKGVGTKAFNAIVPKRPYRDFDDYLMRVPAKGLNSGVIAALVKAGAFDSLGVVRESLAKTEVIEEIIEKARARRQERRNGQTRFRILPLTNSLPSMHCDYDYRRRVELEVIGIELSAPRVSLVVPAFDESGWKWLATTLRGSPGESEVSVIISGHPVPVDARITLTDGLRSGLQASGVMVEEE